MTNTTWFGMNGLQIPASLVDPHIILPGLDTIKGDDLVTRLGRWSLVVEIDGARSADYDHLIENGTPVYLMFLDKAGEVRRGTALLTGVLQLNDSRIRLEWRGQGLLR